jgi:hypothetical protein
MRAAVVYESLFGNTREIAEAVSDGIRTARPEAEVVCLPVTEASTDLVQLDLLVVGAPTQFLGMTSERTRAMQVRYARSAAQQGHAAPAQEPAAGGDGVRGWLSGLPGAARGTPAAAFDTRLDKPLAGGAAPRIARRLRRCGYALAADPEGFIVADMAGPLRAGERGRAQAWGAALVERVSAPARG